MFCFVVHVICALRIDRWWKKVKSVTNEEKYRMEASKGNVM